MFCTVIVNPALLKYVALSPGIDRVHTKLYLPSALATAGGLKVPSALTHRILLGN